MKPGKIYRLFSLTIAFADLSAAAALADPSGPVTALRSVVAKKTAASEPAATPETIKIVPDDIRWADSDQKATSQVYLEKSRTLFIKYSMITPAEAA